MTGPAYRAVARFFESPPRLDIAHREPQVHRPEKPEPLALAVVVLVAGLAGLWFLVTVVLAAVPA